MSSSSEEENLDRRESTMHGGITQHSVKQGPRKLCLQEKCRVRTPEGQQIEVGLAKCELHRGTY